jgi:hypothetical protein
LLNLLINFNIFQALALCVECGRPPAVGGDYFKLENYLPSKFYDFEPGEIVKMHREIGETHSKLAEHFGNVEAEERFIQMCQSDVGLFYCTN